LRVVTVLFSALAAIALGFWAGSTASPTIAVAAAAFAIVTIIAALGGRRRAPQPFAAAHATPVLSSVTMPAVASVAPKAETVTPELSTTAPEQDVQVAQPALEDEPEADVLDPEDVPSDEPVYAAAGETEVAAVEADESAADLSSAAAEQVHEDVLYTDTPVRAEPASAFAPTPEPVPAVRTPFSVQPTVVLMSLHDAAAERYDALAAHLWLQDTSTETLRLVAAFGPRVPSCEPMPLDDPILGAAARSGEAVFASLGIHASHDPASMLWRYAVPVGTPEMRGVAGVDIATPEATPSAFVLNEIAAVLRGSLTAALAIHVAHAEMETAVQLLHAAQELATGVGREELLTAALQRAMTVADASTGSVMLPDPVTGALRIFTSQGLPSQVVADASVAQGEGIAGVVYSSASPLLVEDLPGGPGARRHGVISSASIPITDDRGTLGVINVGSRSFPARLTDAYLRALGILGSQTALAMRNADAAERSWDMYLENLQALASALEANDPFRKDASRRTAVLSVALGHALGLDPDEIVSLRIAAILHDVGMGLATGSVGTTDRPLSTIDRGLVRAHPKVASDVMASVPSLERLAPIVRHHHERYDGAGYDTGLAGDAIPLGSRILAVVDAFVSMTSQRPYREALDPMEALDELAAMSGSQFDPSVVETFRRMLEEKPGLAL
jgi:HD-GYP domain-containing protein (c-di-GMP phosphodiesterase class II)